MSRRVPDSCSPLNVLGCQWPGTEASATPGSSFVLSVENSRRCVGLGGSASATSISEEMDLKLENDRRLQEMREQGKQCLLNRGEHAIREEGAANLLARFHSMQWMRQHHSETATAAAAGSSEANRCVESSHVNLVPVKHGEEEYFPGTRQQKRTRRVKNTRTKFEVVKLEEAVPNPSERIPPAGYQPNPCNAWAVRKGSDLFESRKLNLTLYGPNDSDELFERAVAESLITLAQEQDRIVNMYSSVQSNPEPNGNSINQGINAWAEEKEITVEGGRGDGNWMKADYNRSSRLLVSSKRDEHGCNVPSRNNNSNYGLSLPENSSIGRRQRAARIQQESYRLGNSADTTSQQRDVNDNHEVDNQGYLKNLRGAAHNLAKPQPRMDAGDYVCDEQMDKGRVESGVHQADTKEKFRDMQTKTNINKSKTEKSNYQRIHKKRQENKEDELERLGFSKKKNERSQRDITRRRGQMQGQGHSDQLERPQKGSIMADGDEGRNCGNNRNNRISFSEPYFEQLANGSPVPYESDDDDPWLEPDERPDEPDVVYCPIAHIKPYNNPKLGQETEIEQKLHKTPEMDETTASVNTNIESDTSPASARREAEIQDTPVHHSEDKTDDLAVKSPSKRDSSTSPDPVEKSSDVTIKNTPDKREEIKKMREEIEFLDSRLKLLTTALGQTQTSTSVQPSNTESKACSPIHVETHKSPDPAMSEPVKTEQKDVNVAPSVLFQMPHGSHSMPHGFMHPPGVPLGHPVVHPSMPTMVHPQGHPVGLNPTHQVPVNSMHTSSHAVPDNASPPVHSATSPSAQTHSHPGAHPSVQSTHHLASSPDHLSPHPSGDRVPPGLLQANPSPHPMAHPPILLLTNPLFRPPTPQPLHLQEGVPGLQAGAQSAHPMIPEAVLAHLQQVQQAHAAAANPELQAQLLHYLSQQQLQRQQLAMQGAAAAAASTAIPPGVPGNPLAMGWLGLRPPFAHATPMHKMNMTPVVADAEGMHSTTATALQSAGSIASTAHGSSGIAGTEGATCVENAFIGKEYPPMPSRSATDNSSPEPANSFPGSGLPTMADTLENPTGPSANTVPNKQNESLAMWFAQVNAYQHRQQQQMMQFASAMPGIRVQLPMQRPFAPTLVPSPLSASSPHWPAGPQLGNIPAQYEGDWIISPADEARLGQGLPLVPNENHDVQVNGRPQANILNVALTPAGSVRTLGLPSPTSLKPARPPAHLAGLKQHQQPSDAQVAPNPPMASAAETSFHTLPMAATQMAQPAGVLPSGNIHPAEPRGRGRLRRM